MSDPTPARARFDPLAVECDWEDTEDIAYKVAEAATQAERERCAGICEAYIRDDVRQDPAAVAAWKLAAGSIRSPAQNEEAEAQREAGSVRPGGASQDADQPSASDQNEEAQSGNREAHGGAPHVSDPAPGASSSNDQNEETRNVENDETQGAHGTLSAEQKQQAPSGQGPEVPKDTVEVSASIPRPADGEGNPPAASCTPPLARCEKYTAGEAIRKGATVYIGGDGAAYMEQCWWCGSINRSVRGEMYGGETCTDPWHDPAAEEE